MHCPICLSKSPFPTWPHEPHKEPFKAELKKQTSYARASNSLRGYLCSEGWHVLLISRAYDIPLCQPSQWRGYKSHIHMGRHVIKAQPVGRLEVNKDICLAIWKLLKQLLSDQNTAMRMAVSTSTGAGQKPPYRYVHAFILRTETTALAP